MEQFLWGALSLACVAVAALFMRFWKLTRDRLFLYFSLGFSVFGLNWIALAVLSPPTESRPYIFLLRLAAFLLIIVGIVDKNRRRNI